MAAVFIGTSLRECQLRTHRIKSHIDAFNETITVFRNTK